MTAREQVAENASVAMRLYLLPDAGKARRFAQIARALDIFHPRQMAILRAALTFQRWQHQGNGYWLPPLRDGYARLAQALRQDPETAAPAVSPDDGRPSYQQVCDELLTAHPQWAPDRIAAIVADACARNGSDAQRASVRAAAVRYLRDRASLEDLRRGTASINQNALF